MSDAYYPPPFSLAQCIGRLPLRAQDKHGELRALVADSEALQDSLMERIRAAERKYAEVSRRRAYSSASRDADAVAKLDGDLAAVRASLDKLERERSRRDSVRANTEQVVSRLNNFITALFSGVSEMVPPPQPDSVAAGQREGETITDALLRARNEIRSAQAELMMVRVAPLPAEEIKAAIIEHVDQMAREGRPAHRIEGGKVVVHWADVQLYAGPGQALNAPSGSASRLMCWLDRDRIVAALTAGVVDVAGAIPSTERPGRIRALEARIYGLEIAEERLVMAALEEGLEVHRRPDASPWRRWPRRPNDLLLGLLLGQGSPLRRWRQ